LLLSPRPIKGILLCRALPASLFLKNRIPNHFEDTPQEKTGRFQDVKILMNDLKENPRYLRSATPLSHAQNFSDAPPAMSARQFL